MGTLSHILPEAYDAWLLIVGSEGDDLYRAQVSFDEPQLEFDHESLNFVEKDLEGE